MLLGVPNRVVYFSLGLIELFFPKARSVSFIIIIIIIYMFSFVSLDMQSGRRSGRHVHDNNDVFPHSWISHHALAKKRIERLVSSSNTPNLVTSRDDVTAVEERIHTITYTWASATIFTSNHHQGSFALSIHTNETHEKRKKNLETHSHFTVSMFLLDFSHSSFIYLYHVPFPHSI